SARHTWHTPDYARLSAQRALRRSPSGLRRRRGTFVTKTSEWRDERNRKSLARLEKALPDIFPSAVLARALARPFIPPMPRLAIDGYWRAHPLRADRLARALAAKSGTPKGWIWRLASARKNDLPKSFRFPPAP